MEYLDSSVDICILENKKISIDEAASKAYLDLTESIGYLNGLGVFLDLKLFMRYLLDRKITPYAWFSNFYLDIKLVYISEYCSELKYRLNENPNYINAFVVDKGYVAIKECRYIFSENPKGGIKINNKPVDIKVGIFLAESLVIDFLSDFRINSSWRPRCRVPDDQMSFRSYPLLVARELIQKVFPEHAYEHQAT